MIRSETCCVGYGSVIGMSRHTLSCGWFEVGFVLFFIEKTGHLFGG